MKNKKIYKKSILNHTCYLIHLPVNTIQDGYKKKYVNAENMSNRGRSQKCQKDIEQSNGITTGSYDK